MKKKTASKVKIKYAAYKMPDGRVIEDVSHFAMCMRNPINYFKDSEVGFVTNRGRFVDCFEAAKLAFKVGQIKRKKDRLFSEDLYSYVNDTGKVL